MELLDQFLFYEFLLCILFDTSINGLRLAVMFILDRDKLLVVLYESDDAFEGLLLFVFHLLLLYAEEKGFQFQCIIGFHLAAEYQAELTTTKGTFE